MWLTRRSFPPFDKNLPSLLPYISITQRFLANASYPAECVPLLSRKTRTTKGILLNIFNKRLIINSLFCGNIIQLVQYWCAVINGKWFVRKYIKLPHRLSSYEHIVNTRKITAIFISITAAVSLVIGASAILDRQSIAPSEISLAMLVLLCGFLLLLNYFWSPKWAGFLLYLSISVVLTVNIIFSLGVFDEAMMAYPILIIFTSLIIGKKAVWPLTLISVFEILLIFLLQLGGLGQSLVETDIIQWDDLLITIILLGLTGALSQYVLTIVERTAEEVDHAETELQQSYDLTLQAWSQSLELRGKESLGHSKRVTELAVSFARFLNINEEEVQQIRYGALLHDIGKMGISERILMKQGTLTDKEWEIVREHPLKASEVFEDIPFLEKARNVVLFHHEHMDGNGYPYHLQGEVIPLAARLVAIVDAWDMLRTERPYSAAWSDQDAFAYLKAEAGKKFDHQLVNAFSAFLHKYNLAEQEG